MSNDAPRHAPIRRAVSRRTLLSGSLAAAASETTGQPAGRKPEWMPSFGAAPLAVRQQGGWLVGRFRTAAGVSYEARQRLLGHSATAVAVDARPMEVFLFSGQSNAGGSPIVEERPDSHSPFVSDPWFPQHLLTTNHWTGTYADKPVAGSCVTDLSPARDHPRYGTLPQTTFLLTLEALNRAEGKLGPGYAARTDWWGSQPLDVFLKGGVQFANTLASARLLAQQAATYGRLSRIGALVFIHGENRGSHTRAGYAAALARHFDTLREALPGQGTTAALPILFTQINQGTTWPRPSGTELAQLDVHSAGGAPNWLCGPMYQLPLAVEIRNGRSSAIHQNIPGKMMLGEMLAVAYRTIVRDGSFTPLRPLRVGLQGETLTLELAVPARSRLALDADWLTGRPSGHAGFIVEAGRENVPVSAIRIEGTSRVALQLGKPVPDGPVTLRYALDPQPVDLSQAAAGDACFAPSTGLLMAETDIPSPFAEHGFAVPKRIRHYCVRFSMQAR